MVPKPPLVVNTKLTSLTFPVVVLINIDIPNGIPFTAFFWAVVKALLIIELHLRFVQLSSLIRSTLPSKISSSIVTSFHFQNAEVTVRVDGGVSYERIT